ncbi:MAG: hypothetical protein JNJ51_08870 [Methylobacillus glycogenes]|nr:hypothetical protein [Methylobacillus glycogenes]
MFARDIEKSIYDSQQSLEVLKTLRDDIQAYAKVLTVDDVLDLIDQRIYAANRQERSNILAFKLDAHLPRQIKAAMVNT